MVSALAAVPTPAEEANQAARTRRPALEDRWLEQAGRYVQGRVADIDLLVSSAEAKQQLRGSVRNSGALTRRDAAGYGQHFWCPA